MGITMRLTDVIVRSAKPGINAKGMKTNKSYKLSDGGGLYLEVLPAGGKYWRLKYRFKGKEKKLSLGVYPTVKLKEARDEREKAKKLLTKNIDPGEHKKIVKKIETENSFEFVAREWHLKFKSAWTENHGNRILRRLEVDIFPWVGSRPINEINAPELLAALRRIESRGALETAHRAMQNCGQVFRYAVATGRAERDPTGDLKGALPPAREKHHASITCNGLQT
jgi:Phage integrase central domain/Arm DNA-binding domain